MDGLKSLCSTQHLIRNLNGIKVVEWGEHAAGKTSNQTYPCDYSTLHQDGHDHLLYHQFFHISRRLHSVLCDIPVCPTDRWCLEHSLLPRPQTILSPNSTVTPGPCCFCIAEMDSTGLLTSNPLLLSLSLSTLKVRLSILY